LTNDVLTPEQIAELVAAAKSGDVPDQASRKTRQRRVRDIDFTRPVKLAPDQERRFERAHEAFCRTASTRLSAELRTPIEFEVINVEQMTWSGAIANVPPPSIFGVVGTVPAETTILLCGMIGGSGNEKPPNRSLTELELALTRRIYAGLIEQLGTVWRELFDLDLKLLELDTQVANVELAPPSEPTVVLTIETRDGPSSSTISLLVPYRSIANVSGRLSGQYNDVAEAPVLDAELGAVLQASIGAVEVEARAEVGAVELTIGEVLALREGEIIRLDAQASAGVSVFVGDTPLYHAKPGRSGNRRAAEITERL
jgi:flagellar motor switch protein FliM